MTTNTGLKAMGGAGDQRDGRPKAASVIAGRMGPVGPRQGGEPLADPGSLRTEFELSRRIGFSLGGATACDREDGRSC